MNKTLLAAVLAVGLMVGGMTGVAQATSFTVSDGSFSSLVGNTTGFTWNVAALSTPGFDLTTIGQTKTINYGHFSTTAFPISAADAAAQTDTFNVSFNVTPPSTGNSLQSVGTVDAIMTGYWTWFWYTDTSTASVDFNNTPITKAFGNGGQYDVVFNDLTNISANGSYDLTATITLDSLDRGTAPVPEPGTMMLLGLGMAGLAVYGKRRMNKEA